MPSGDLPSQVVSAIKFMGKSGGTVKSLGGFQKGRHRIPDTINATTTAFLGKLGAAELAEAAEALFREARTQFGYKRKDLALTLAGPVATLTAKDFTVELAFAFAPGDPSRYGFTTTLSDLSSKAVAESAETTAVFRRRFTEISFELREGTRVEALIDAVEGLDPAGGLAVDYPPGCEECILRVEGTPALVRCTGETLQMVFPQPGTPAELIASFAAVREAFQLSKALAGLVR